MESTYPSQRPDCPSLSPYFLLTGPNLIERHLFSVPYLNLNLNASSSLMSSYPNEGYTGGPKFLRRVTSSMLNIDFLLTLFVFSIIICDQGIPVDLQVVARKLTSFIPRQKSMFCRLPIVLQSKLLYVVVIVK